MTINAQNYAATPRTEVAQVVAANTNRDGTGTLVTVFTAGAGGSRIDDITITPAVTTTVGMVRLFIHDGATARLWREVSILANTPSASNPVMSTQLANLGLILKTGYSLRASTHNAEAINICVTRAGDF